jgi:integrative and conjugative element protein (TIGR02256 family)
VNKAAVAQIEQFASKDGAIQLKAVFERDGFTFCKVSLDTRAIPHSEGGIRVRSREVFLIAAPEDYPFSPPSVIASHSRWAGTAHVQWGSHICIYAAPSVEWSPADGMRGLIDRLVLWLERAALGTLDPEGQPLHPPVAYATPAAGHLVIHADVGERVPWSTKSEATSLQFAWCAMDGSRIDVVEWLDYGEIADRVVAAEFQPRDEHGRSQLVAVAAFISDQIGFEYPKKAQALVDALARSGLPAERLLEDMSRARLVNSYLESKLVDGTSLPNVVILGTPSRRIGQELLAHLSAWRLQDIGNDLADLLRSANWGVLQDRKQKIFDLAKSWIGLADTSWMRVWEDRHEVTRPRDGGTNASTLRGRKVLILGAGALGAPIAEFCVRAGVSELTVADEGRVGPGILVRQPYSDADITKPKAKVLAERLSTIRLDLKVDGVFGDAKDTVLSSAPGLQGFDLVIDATADVGVRTAIEARRRTDTPNWPDILTVMIGHDAKRGIVTASARGASGGPADVLRRFSIDCLASPHLRDIAEDFFPTEARVDMFFPEPGCSSPTFVGSQADAAGLAGMLLNEGIALLRADSEPMGAAAVRRTSSVLPSVDARGWKSDAVATDANGSGYEIRITNVALAEMRAESRRGQRVRGPGVETGGMLLGAIDDAYGVIHVDRVVGPPPDSRLSAFYFQHGIVGTQEKVDERRRATGNRQSFVGLWHTHPCGKAAPSATDDEGMWELVSLHDVGRRALMVILGGDGWGRWLQDATPPSIYARVSVLGGATSPAFSGGFIVVGEPSFPGGFAYPEYFHTTPGPGAR